MSRSVIISTGSYLPQRIVSNHDLAQKVDTSDEWIVQRTGIHARHIADAHETTSFMASEAARICIDKAGITPGDVDGVIVATATPDLTFPSVAALVQGKLGLKTGPAMDVQAACSGFIYALATAHGLLETGVAKRLLVIGAEKFSSIVNWEDRRTCVLFGDGAGAVLLERQDDETQRGILSTHLHANGCLKDILYTSGGVATTKDSGFIHMEGQEVFRHAVSLMKDVVNEVLDHNKIQPNEIDWLVPHQANIRIIESTAKKLDMPMEKVVVTVDRHGNTSAASIPLALDHAVREGQIKSGQLLLMEALGGGLTWAGALLRF